MIFNRLRRKVTKHFKKINKFIELITKMRDKAEQTLAEIAEEKRELRELEIECQRVKKTAENILSN